MTLRSRCALRTLAALALCVPLAACEDKRTVGSAGGRMPAGAATLAPYAVSRTNAFVPPPAPSPTAFVTPRAETCDDIIWAIDKRGIISITQSRYPTRGHGAQSFATLVRSTGPDRGVGFAGGVFSLILAQGMLRRRGDQPPGRRRRRRCGYGRRACRRGGRRAGGRYVG